MAKVIIFGLGDTAELAYYYLSKDTEHNVIAFTIDDEYIQQEKYNDLQLVNFSNIEYIFPPNNYLFFVALGYSQVNKLREKKYLEVKAKGYKFISYISPRTTICDNVTIGDNCFILEENVIQPYTLIGDNVTLWSGSHVGHHSIIKDHCFIAPRVAISGRVVINRNTFIGLNSTLRDNVKIGAYNVIGAGSLIMHDTKDNDLYIPERTQLNNKRSYELKKI